MERRADGQPSTSIFTVITGTDDVGHGLLIALAMVVDQNN